MYHYCFLCGKKLNQEIGDEYTQKCSCGKFQVQVYHYGYDIIIDDDKFFHFDESGYGNDREQKALEKCLQERSEQDGK